MLNVQADLFGGLNFVVNESSTCYDRMQRSAASLKGEITLEGFCNKQQYQAARALFIAIITGAVTDINYFMAEGPKAVTHKNKNTIVYQNFKSAIDFLFYPNVPGARESLYEFYCLQLDFDADHYRNAVLQRHHTLAQHLLQQ